ncbi:MAG: NADH dehydrogenase FAD-containing subunit [Planctomycetes bacterium]|nr:NADH dehydrogenase FAD-containing subunit [Planctomycetota bacterium]
MILALVLLPALAGIAAFLIKGTLPRRALLVLTAVAHTGLTAWAWADRPSGVPEGWLALDAPGLLFLSLTSALFLASAVYAVGYLSREKEEAHADFEEGMFFTNVPEAIFTGCLLLFLSTMTLVTVSRHFGILWVAIEATTLASAPLIYFHRHHRSLEATWKYLLICSVGIALALLGNFFLAVAASGGTPRTPVVLDALLADAAHLNIPWLKAAFLCLLVGYGTKMGLAPLHTWLPDAHSEAPSVVSALLSGALLNCAFLGILRMLQVCVAAGEGAFGMELLVGFGLLSMGVAAVFILGQADYKRMLAYSSVEHMGILALGVGLGGAATFGAMFHAMNHSLTKAMLFLLAGNILAVCRTKQSSEIRGLGRLLPVTSALWLVGFLAITGSPPFAPFLSEFTILRAAIDAGRGGVAAAYLCCLALIFIGMATAVLRMTLGEPSRGAVVPSPREPALSIVPPAVLAVFVLLFGLYLPPAVGTALEEAAAVLAGVPK